MNAQYDPTRETPVGDLKSNAKGSGARDNGGKMRADLLTWHDVSYLFDMRDGPMGCLGRFQETHDPAELRELVNVLYQGDIQQALVDAAGVFEFGAKKYKAWNWHKGMAWSVPVACIGRHLLAIQRGEIFDKDSGLAHAGHVVCNVFMLLCYCRTYREGNDLPNAPAPFLVAKPLSDEELRKIAGQVSKGPIEVKPVNWPELTPRSPYIDDVVGRDRPLEVGDQ